MTFDTKSVQGQMVVYCPKCGRRQQMTEYRGIYCPGCQRSSRGCKPEFILHCAECQKPLAVVLVPKPDGDHFGSYCVHCRFAPSMQDTFLQKINREKPAKK